MCDQLQHILDLHGESKPIQDETESSKQWLLRLLKGVYLICVVVGGVA